MTVTIDTWLSIATWLVPLARLVVASIAIVHVLLFKLNSRAAVAWIALVLIFPLSGSLIYWLLGINRLSNDDDEITGRPSVPLNSDKAAESTARFAPVGSVGRQVTGDTPLMGNRIELLQDGEQAFPAMLDAIGRAKTEVLLTTYIFERDDIGAKFISAMLAAQKRGVQVCVLLDDVGRRHNWPTILPKLKQADIETRCFNKLRLLPPNLGINLRNHRKMLIVDQHICFAGGMNIGARHLTSRPSPDQASDLCFQFMGPILESMREVFERDWVRSGGGKLIRLPVTEQSSVGKSACRLIVDGPDEELDKLTLTILGIISTAQERIMLITPYFLPNARIVGALQAAALRGVEVNVIIPSHCNWPMVRWALNHRVIQLLKVGVNVLEQPLPFVHSKCLLVDDDYALVGSANIDERSLRLNFELGVEIFDASFCLELGDYANHCLHRAKLVDPSEVELRSTVVRLRDSVASLFEPYL